MDKDFTDDLTDKVIFLINDIRLIASVQYLGKIYLVLFCDFFICFQQFQSIPAVIFQIRIPLLQCWDNLVNLILDSI